MELLFCALPTEGTQLYSLRCVSLDKMAVLQELCKFHMSGFKCTSSQQKQKVMHMADRTGHP